MVLTRSQELTDINLSFVNDINSKLSDVSEKFNEFTSNYDKIILSCNNSKALTLICSPESFSWSGMLLRIHNTVEERQFN